MILSCWRAALVSSLADGSFSQWVPSIGNYWVKGTEECHPSLLHAISYRSWCLKSPYVWSQPPTNILGFDICLCELQEKEEWKNTYIFYFQELDLVSSIYRKIDGKYWLEMSFLNSVLYCENLIQDNCIFFLSNFISSLLIANTEPNLWGWAKLCCLHWCLRAVFISELT